jgi:hypothetical protein
VALQFGGKTRAGLNLGVELWFLFGADRTPRALGKAEIARATRLFFSRYLLGFGFRLRRGASDGAAQGQREAFGVLVHRGLQLRERFAEAFRLMVLRP